MLAPLLGLDGEAISTENSLLIQGPCLVLLPGSLFVSEQQGRGLTDLYSAYSIAAEHAVGTLYRPHVTTY